LREFDKGMLSRIFDPKREEVTDSWRKLHNAELAFQIEFIAACSYLGSCVHY
jgi:hypothetical protein